MKKLVLILSVLMCMTCMPTHVQAKEATEVEPVEDFTEEVAMFEDFYSYPAVYIFQNHVGDDMNDYLLSREDDFHANPLETTKEMMESVGTVLDLRNTVAPLAMASKKWKDQKVYYTPGQYVMFDFLAKAQVDDWGRIKYATGEGQYLRIRSANYYFLDETHKIDVGKSKITYNLTHTIYYGFSAKATRYSKIVW